MSVYFVYRSHYEGPSGKHLRVFDGDSVLGWFQSAWERSKAADDVPGWLKAELGCEVYGLASIFEAARDESLPPPTSDRKLNTYLEEHLYIEGEILFKSHALQVLTDDDEIELAYYFFDDHYLRDNPGRAAYLLHDDWRLSKTSGNDPYLPSFTISEIQPAGNNQGTTYLAFLAFYDSLNLTDLDVEGPRRIEGVRLPELCEYLHGTIPDQDWPFELKLLRSQVSIEGDLRAAFEQAARFPVHEIMNSMNHRKRGFGLADQAREEFESILAGIAEKDRRYDPSKSIIEVGDHLAQLCLHVGWMAEMYHQWIIFDDLWAGANPALAEGILRYGQRWDVLTD